MSGIKTVDAILALKEVVREQARAAAGSNVLISRREAESMDPVLQRTAEKLRAEGGRGTRVSVDALVERAVADTVAFWGQYNSENLGRDGAWLSREELGQITAADPEAATLVNTAIARVNLCANVKTFFDAFDFSGGRFRTDGLVDSERIDARPGHGERRQVPKTVLKSFDYFYRAEEADWASVSLQRGIVAGYKVWATYMTTDGDDEYLEVFTEGGQPLVSARLWAGGAPTWDEFFGRDRLAGTFTHLDEPEYVEGLSEEAERVAAGQVSNTWQGDVQINAGAIHHAEGHISRIELKDGLLDNEQRDVAYIAFDRLWEYTLQHRVDGAAPLELGQEGVMKVGAWTRPTDGKKLLVASWRDIDDASYVFYFEPDAAGPKLLVEQSDN
ncbi:MAG: hypothetical protein A2341_20850 [Deltaproteobacteria bacterium RIFOXYB12_FULL_58_9]|nr:MAG: hypothetical protein A2341_20850 [Deltaproteobacteria bacterium RIFOXYB12_FULL_58_9]